MSTLEFAKTDAEAAARFREHARKDPFAGEIPAALLGMQHVRRYVAKTGMVFPFDDAPRHRKLASYEVRARGKCIYWSDTGEKIVVDLREGVDFRLKPNSIAFVTLEPRFRLPDYIAVRFNLKITHVYRGLLAGTGPLVDPGYDNLLFVPLHNLTTNEYVIRGGDPLVWMEFTKTSIGSEEAEGLHTKSINPSKSEELGDIEFYLRKADPYRPIRSSIPYEIAGAKKEAREARRSIQLLSLSAAAALIFAAGGVVYPIVSLVKDAQQISSAAIEKIDDVKRVADSYSRQQRDLEVKLERIEKRLKAAEARR